MSSNSNKRSKNGKKGKGVKWGSIFIFLINAGLALTGSEDGPKLDFSHNQFQINVNINSNTPAVNVIKPPFE